MDHPPQFYNLNGYSKVWTETHLLPEHVEQWASKSDPRTRTTDLREPIERVSHCSPIQIFSTSVLHAWHSQLIPKNGTYCFDTDARLPTTEPGQTTQRKKSVDRLTVLKKICCVHQILYCWIHLYRYHPLHVVQFLPPANFTPCSVQKDIVTFTII